MVSRDVQMMLINGISSTDTRQRMSKLLMEAGCNSVTFEADKERLICTKEGPRGTDITYAFSIDPTFTEALIQARPDLSSTFRTKSQAQRAMYRIVYEWLRSALDVVSTNLVTFEQMFLCFAVLDADPQGRTVYEVSFKARTEDEAHDASADEP